MSDVYWRSVEHLDHIDLYRVLDLYGVRDHAIGHAIKKLLCAGQRGAKSEAQDVDEAIDTLARWRMMQAEDLALVPDPAEIKVDEGLYSAEELRQFLGPRTTRKAGSQAEGSWP